MPKADKTKILIEITHKQAEQLGFLRCKHCGYPRNNHFSFGLQVCAHVPCPGYEEILVIPK